MNNQRAEALRNPVPTWRNKVLSKAVIQDIIDLWICVTSAEMMDGSAPDFQDPNFDVEHPGRSNSFEEVFAAAGGNFMMDEATSTAERYTVRLFVLGELGLHHKLHSFKSISPLSEFRTLNFLFSIITEASVKVGTDPFFRLLGDDLIRRLQKNYLLLKLQLLFVHILRNGERIRLNDVIGEHPDLDGLFTGPEVQMINEDNSRFARVVHRIFCGVEDAEEEAEQEERQPPRRRPRRPAQEAHREEEGHPPRQRRAPRRPHH